MATAQLVGLPADYEQMRRAYVVTGTMNRVDLVRAAQDLGFKARALQYAGAVLPDNLPLPAIVILRDGSPLILLRYDAENVLLVDAVQAKQFAVTRNSFTENWSGELVLLAKRIRLVSELRRFGLRWFIPVVVRY
ncbi:MAG: type I secretion system permease/ATPase, partial [Deltaproteobacteria bacterium]|nr:type I secretion system permease/ATPase [Deltaproteobacteria bacterium]